MLVTMSTLASTSKPVLSEHQNSLLSKLSTVSSTEIAGWISVTSSSVTSEIWNVLQLLDVADMVWISKNARSGKECNICLK